MIKATLDGSDLPEQFHYEPATPHRRTSELQTSNAVVRQVATAIVSGDSLIPFECQACSQAEWQWFQDKYNQVSDPNMAFTGYWGDVMVVKFHKLDTPKIRSRLFNVSGSLRVVSVTTWHE